MMLELMDSQLHISWETICVILHEDLGKKKMCAKFVPYGPAHEEKEHLARMCEDFMQISESQYV
jgi:hypothetical protein